MSTSTADCMFSFLASDLLLDVSYRDAMQAGRINARLDCTFRRDLFPEKPTNGTLDADR